MTALGFPVILLVTPSRSSLLPGIEEGAHLQARSLGYTLQIEVQPLGDSIEINQGPELDTSIWHRRSEVVGHIFCFSNKRMESTAHHFHAQGRPVVALPDPINDVPCIQADGAEAMKKAVHALAVSGKRRIVFLAGRSGYLGATERERGYLEGLREAGLEYDPALVVKAEYYDLAAALGMERLIKAAIPFDAVLGANDGTALAAIETMRRFGLPYPAIPVIGFDDIRPGRHIEPPLPTFRLSGQLMGMTAVRLIHEAIQNRQPISPTFIRPCFIRTASLPASSATPLTAGALAESLAVRFAASTGALAHDALLETARELIDAASHGRLAPRLESATRQLIAAGAEAELIQELLASLRTHLPSAPLSHPADWHDAEKVAKHALAAGLNREIELLAEASGVSTRFRMEIRSEQAAPIDVATAVLRTIYTQGFAHIGVWLRDDGPPEKETGTLYRFDADQNRATVVIPGLDAAPALTRFQAEVGAHPVGFVSVQHSGRRHALLLLAGSPARCSMLAEFGHELSHVLHERQLRDALVAARVSADAASRSKSQFLANMSHEIRTPMNGIIGMTDLALGLAANPTQRDYLETALDSAHGLLALLNDILDLSKIEAGHLELERIAFDLEDMLENALQAVACRAVEKSLELSCHLSQTAPERIIGDPVRLRQIIVNLVSNAIKFTEKGEVIVRVDTLQSPDGPRLCCSVSDTGIGIAPGQINRLFEPFQQADTTITRRFGGTGLGLSISSSLVGEMGGRIDCASRLGSGSTFRFDIPLVSATAAPPINTPAQPLAGLLCLVVNDQATGRDLLAGLLRRLGAEVLAAESEAAASDALRSFAATSRTPDFLFIDEGLQAHSGKTVAARLRRLLPLRHPPLLVAAGIKCPTPASSREEETTVHIPKPIFKKRLLSSLTRLIHRQDGAAKTATLPDRKLSPAWSPVLLAEDNPVNQRITQALLGRLGAEPVLAQNGLEALELWRRLRPPLIFMDVHMPEMDGLETTRRIRAEESQSPTYPPTLIIALTACAMQGDAAQCTAAGMNGYVSKPFRSPALVEELVRLGVGFAAPTPPSPSGND